MLSARPRLTPGDDEGMTLIEVLAALFVLSVALLGLLSVFATAAQSISEQQWRATANRLLIEHLESIRLAGWDSLPDEASPEGCGPDVDGATTITTAGGLDFAIVDAVERIDAVTGEVDVDGAVKQVTSTICWRTRGQQRDMSHTTAISQQDPSIVETEPTISVEMQPDPIEANEDGESTQELVVEVFFAHIEHDEDVRLSWPQDAEEPFHEIIPYQDGAWTHTFAEGELSTVLDEEGDGSLVFLVEGAELSTTHAVQFRRGESTDDDSEHGDDDDGADDGNGDDPEDDPESTPPSFAEVAISAPPSEAIVVDRHQIHSSECPRSSNDCTNKFDVAFQAVVENPDGLEVREIYVRIPLFGGNSLKFDLLDETQSACVTPTCEVDATLESREAMIRASQTDGTFDEQAFTFYFRYGLPGEDSSTEQGGVVVEREVRW